ncbi:MAG: CDP-diacylglycerol--glycerol-3-phosphate 3-phosphatidyltransferase [Mariprofundus sp.]|nr:CDP-diacylglycerol--glycerol-3-phosphate 3-phosphatidyltransferase [Mariprofundus sp.]
MKWTISNQLTIGRVLIIPVFMVAFLIPGDLGHWLSGILFIIAALTDYLDGYLARLRNEVTPFGRFLDPVADKLLVASALVLLVSADMAPALLAVIIIGREITIGALREWLAQRATIVHVSLIAKWKTAIQLIAISTLLLHVDIFGLPLHLIGLILLWFAAFLTLWSGYEYVRDAWPELMDEMND